MASAIIVTTGTSFAGTVFVDASNPNCPGSGTQANPYCKIQDGINAAVQGDTVLVAPGTYVENIDFLGKAIVVRSSGGVANTVIDGGGAGSVVTFQSNEGPASVLDGFTITNGSGSECFGRSTCGGGIFCRNASPTITNNKITRNVTTRGFFARGGSGSGIFVQESFATIINNTITRNHAPGYGGGIAVYPGSGCPTISDNVIRSNTAGRWGGGVQVQSAARVSNNKIRSNYAPYAGGIAVRYDGAVLSHNTIRANGAVCGGGIGMRQGTGTVARNVVQSNTAKADGGGVFLQVASPLLLGNMILSNTAGGRGGGLFVESWDAGNATVINTIFASNTAAYGGGLALTGRSETTLINDTIAFNTAGVASSLLLDGLGEYRARAAITNSVIWGNSPGAPFQIDRAVNVRYSDVQGGYPGTGNINLYPRFLDPSTGDFRLACDSPCVDAGTNSPAGADLPDLDQEGRDLRAIGTVDMGADEVGTFWSFNGPATVGGPPVHFTAGATAAQSGFVALVFVSLGDGGSQGGIPLPFDRALERRLMLDRDALFTTWLHLPGAFRAVFLNGCAGAPSAGLAIPSSVPVGVTVFYAGFSMDGAGSLISVTETKSFLTQ